MLKAQGWLGTGSALKELTLVICYLSPLSIPLFLFLSLSQAIASEEFMHILGLFIRSSDTLKSKVTKPRSLKLVNRRGGGRGQSSVTPTLPTLDVASLR